MAFFSLKTVMKVNGEFQPFYVKSFRHLRKVLSLLSNIVLFDKAFERRTVFKALFVNNRKK